MLLNTFHFGVKCSLIHSFSQMQHILRNLVTRVQIIIFDKLI